PSLRDPGLRLVGGTVLRRGHEALRSSGWQARARTVQDALPGGDPEALAEHRGERPIAVGNRVAPVPPHRSGRAAFPHPAPTSDSDGKTLRPSVRVPASVSRFPGSVSGACVAGARSPRPPPF